MEKLFSNEKRLCIIRKEKRERKTPREVKISRFETTIGKGDFHLD